MRHIVTLLLIIIAVLLIGFLVLIFKRDTQVADPVNVGNNSQSADNRDIKCQMTPDAIQGIWQGSLKAVLAVNEELKKSLPEEKQRNLAELLESDALSLNSLRFSITKSSIFISYPKSESPSEREVIYSIVGIKDGAIEAVIFGKDRPEQKHTIYFSLIDSFLRVRNWDGRPISAGFARYEPGNQQDENKERSVKVRASDEKLPSYVFKERLNSEPAGDFLKSLGAPNKEETIYTDEGAFSKKTVQKKLTFYNLVILAGSEEPPELHGKVRHVNIIVEYKDGRPPKILSYNMFKPTE